MSRKPRTVGELIDALAAYPRDALVCATWEGTVNAIEVVQSRDGVVVIDADAISSGVAGRDCRKAVEKLHEDADYIAECVTHEACGGCSECEAGHDEDDEATAAAAP